MDRQKAVDPAAIEKYLKILVLIFTCFIFITAVYHPYDHDEFEHIHSAWYIQNGFRPYADFFEHHHSLFWYILKPFLQITGETTTALVVIRLFMFFLTMGIGWVVHSIAKDLGGSNRAGWLAVVILFSTVLFVQKSIEVRPDVPQVLFGLLSLRFFIRFSASRQRKDLFLSALCASFSFLFLQKAVFYLAACGLFLFLLYNKKKISLGQILMFSLIVAVPFAGYLLILHLQGTLGDYLITNWSFNLNRGFRTVPFGTFALSLLENSLFWVASFLVVFFLLRKKMDPRFQFLFVVLAVYVIFIFVVNRPWAQYLLFPIALLSVMCACFLIDHADLLKTKKVLATGLLLLYFVSPALSFLVRIGIGNKNQREVIQYVLDQTDRNDRVFDGDSQFNLFRLDLHYFWLDVGFYDEGWKHPKKIRKKLSDFDIPSLIQKFQPVIITDYKMDSSTEPLFRSYEKTDYRLYLNMNTRKPGNSVNIFQRKEEK